MKKSTSPGTTEFGARADLEHADREARNVLFILEDVAQCDGDVRGGYERILPSRPRRRAGMGALTSDADGETTITLDIGYRADDRATFFENCALLDMGLDETRIGLAKVAFDRIRHGAVQTVHGRAHCHAFGIGAVEHFVEVRRPDIHGRSRQARHEPGTLLVVPDRNVDWSMR